MFQIEKNMLLNAEDRYVKYKKQFYDSDILLTVRADMQKKAVTAKIRIKNAPFDNEPVFEIITLVMPIEENEHFNLGLNFHFKKAFRNNGKRAEAVDFIYQAISGITDILKRWVAPDGIFFLLTHDTSKNMDTIIDIQYRDLKEKGKIEDGINEEDAKFLIAEQLSKFYLEHAETFPELSPMVKLINANATTVM